MTLIILEGPNGAGKSTIAESLKADHTLHAGPPAHSNPFDEWVLPLVPFTADEHRDSLIVCDRWHVGELVYPYIIGRPRIADAMEIRQISAALSQMFEGRVVIAYVLPPLPDLEHRFKQRDEHWQVKWAQVVTAWTFYSALADDDYFTYKCKRVKIDGQATNTRAFVEGWHHLWR